MDDRDEKIHYFDELDTAETRRLLQEQQARASIMMEMAQTASSSLDLDQVLSHVAEGIAAAAGVEHCGLFLVDEEQGTVLPRFEVTVEPMRVVGRQNGMRPETVPRPLSTFSDFIHEVVAAKAPRSSYDVQRDPRFENSVPRRVGFRSILAVPFVVKGRVVAIAYALTFDEYRTFSEEQVKLVQGIANAVALAIENARLHQQVRSLAALEERDRLARELHDSIAQALSTLKLQASYLGELLNEGDVEQARTWLAELKQTIAEANADVREGIFSLRTSVPRGGDLVPALQDYLTKYHAFYGLDVRLVAQNDAPVTLGLDAAAQVMRIVQEALANVHKHAGTDRAEVRIETLADGFHITVADHGLGFDAARLAGDDSPGYGLQVMRERAQMLGGRLEIDAQPGQGTRVVLWLPVENATITSTPAAAQEDWRV